MSTPTIAGGDVPKALGPRDMEAAFHYLHDLFRAPDSRQWAWLNSAECAAFWRALGREFGTTDTYEDLGLPSAEGEYESQYIASFEAGGPHPPLPLIESHHNRRDPVPRVLHENVLFYDAFGLRLRSKANETADHLRHQLEFVAHLFALEAGGVEEGGKALTGEGPGDAGSTPPPVDRRDQIQRARTEYISRHLLSWLPQAERIAADAPYPWVRRYLGRTLHVVSSASGT